MASFAKLNSENIVIRIESIHNNELLDNGVESEEKGIQFLRTLYNEPNVIWKKTSYNTKGGKHYLSDNSELSNTQEKTFRKNYAGIGYTYDLNRDAFIPPKPYNSWILNETTCLWESPVLYPADSKAYYWDEESLSWKE
jgi:hypothetical protein